MVATRTGSSKSGVACGVVDSSDDDDCRHGLHGLLISVALLVVAAMVALGTVPIALILLAELLMQAAGVSGAAAYAIAAMCGFIVAATLGLVGWSRLRRIRRVFHRSREEMTRNITWIKNALKQSVPKESEQLHDC